MPFTIQKSTLCAVVFFLLSLATPIFAAKLSVSTEVQDNITLLTESKSCPQCNLSGATLNRLDLSGANLEGADLSRAKFYLSNLSGANLRNTNLKEAEFGGADLADADLTGADLTGASLVGAYIVGAKLDGEMVSTKPYIDDDISEVEEDVYVEDTVKPKSIPATEDITIRSRRDFEETSPAVDLKIEDQEIAENPVVEEVTGIVNEKKETGVPDVSVAAPSAKSAPAMNNVLIQKHVAPAEDIEKTEIEYTDSAAAIEKEKINTVEKIVIEEAAENAQTESGENSEETEKNIDNETVGQETKTQEITSSQIEVKVGEKSNTTENSELSQTAVADIVPKQDSVAVLQSVVMATEVAPLSDKVLLNVERLLDSNACYGCDLTGANLGGKNLDSADLEGADLSNANLAGADLEDANLKAANLTNVDLSGADLSGADCYKANLSNANLNGAKLENVLLDDAEMTGVQGYQQELLLLETN